MKWLAETAGALLDLILPPHCTGCGTAIRSGYWCETCSENLSPIAPPRCEICSHPFHGAIEGPFVCPNCAGRTYHFECAVSVVPSRGPVRELIHRLKYQGAEWAARPLAELGLLGLNDPRLADDPPHVIVPVPLHPLRERERGYNQAQLLANRIGRQAGIPVWKALRRIRPTTTQTHFDRRRRMQNLRGAFALSHNVDVRDRSLLLLDDVLTTGSTIDECARVLARSGAKSLRALTIARG